jgi:uncharacterized protein (DUF433 family)
MPRRSSRKWNNESQRFRDRLRLMLPSERIVVDPEILAGKPVIRGTRLAVELILDLLAAGQSESEILTNTRD